jgi:hypothetical protein
MKGRNLVILAAMAVVLIGMAVRTSRKEGESVPDGVGRKLLAELAVNDIEQVVVTDGARQAAVVRTEAGWEVPARYGFPANFAKLRAGLLKLSELKIGQVPRLTEKQRKDLKMMASGDTNQTGRTVDLLGAGGKKIASLLIGAAHMRKSAQSMGGGYPDGQYVSADGGKSVYLVSQTLEEFSESPQNWLDTELMSVQSEEIENIQISGPGRADVKMVRAEGSGFSLEGLQATEELDAAKASGAQSALSYLRIEDVADPALTEEQLGLKSPVVYRAVTKKGETYTVRVGGSPTNDARRYIRAGVSLAPAPAAAASTNAAPEVAKAAEERKELELSVQTLNAKLSKWTFLVDADKAGELSAARESLVKPKEVPKTKDEPGELPQAPAPEAGGK